MNMHRKPSPYPLFYSLLIFLSAVAAGCAGKGKGGTRETLPPLPPENVSSSLTLQGVAPTIEVTWTDRSDNEQGFKINARAKEETTYSTIGDVVADTRAFLDTQSPHDKSAYYRVNAYNSEGESSSISESLRLGLIATIEKTGITDFDLQGGVLFILWNEGLASYDISSPKQPLLLKNVELSGSVRSGSLSVGASDAVLVDDDRFFCVDISDPRNPIVKGELATGAQPIDMVRTGKTAFLITADGSLLVIDTQNCSKPRVARSIGLDVHPKNLALFKDRLFVAAARDGLLIYDLKAPSNPVLLKKFTPYPPRYYNAVSVWQNKLAVSIRDFENELDIIDITDLSDMRVEGKIALDWIPMQASITDSVIFVPEAEAGVEMVWWKDAKKMRVTGRIESQVERIKAWPDTVLMSFENSLYLLSSP